MNKDETKALVQRFVGYARELRGPNVKPVPPFLFEISKDSRDHSREVYEEVIMPGFPKNEPRAKNRPHPLRRGRAQFLEGGEGSAGRHRAVGAANLERRSRGWVLRLTVQRGEASDPRPLARMMDSCIARYHKSESKF